MNQASFRSHNLHLWSASLNVADQIYEELEQYLSPDERRRADQFVFSQDHRNFVAARGILRSILARYLNCQPGNIFFNYSTDGKPALGSPELAKRLEFNLSHSSGFLVVAVTQGLKVGVDIELLRQMPDMNLIASHSFSECEQKAFSRLPVEETLPGFFGCWTRKEAYLKAIGDGLSIPLDSFDVSLSPENPISMLSNRINPDAVSGWSFFTFVPSQGFIGAVVIEGQTVTPYFMQWEAGEVRL